MKAELNARVKITAGPAVGLYGIVIHVDKSTWSADVLLDDGRTAKSIPLKHCEAVEELGADARTKLLDRIRKIWAKAESLKAMGPEYETEAMTFAASAQKMLARYKLDMSDLEIEAMERDEPVAGEWLDEDAGRERSKRAAWSDQLAEVVARAHFVRVLFSSRGADSLFLVGRATDRKIAHYVIRVLQRAADEMSDKAARQFRKAQRRAVGATTSDNRNFRAAWLNGFVERIAERYRNEEAEMERQQKAVGGTSLVLVTKQSLAKIDDHIKATIKVSYGRGPRQKQSGVNSAEAGRAAGRAAANNVNIRGTGLGTSTTTRKHLGA